MERDGNHIRGTLQSIRQRNQPLTKKMGIGTLIKESRLYNYQNPSFFFFLLFRSHIEKKF